MREYGDTIRELAIANVFAGRHALAQLRRQPPRPRRLLRLRRDRVPDRLHVPGDPAAAEPRGGDVGRAVVPGRRRSTSSRRSSRPSCSAALRCATRSCATTPTCCGRSSGSTASSRSRAARSWTSCRTRSRCASACATRRPPNHSRRRERLFRPACRRFRWKRTERRVQEPGRRARTPVEWTARRRVVGVMRRCDSHVAVAWVLRTLSDVEPRGAGRHGGGGLGSAWYSAFSRSSRRPRPRPRAGCRSDSTTTRHSAGVPERQMLSTGWRPLTRR